LPEAEQALRDALRIQEQLCTDFASVPAYRQAMARSHSSLGMVHRKMKQSAEAERDYVAAGALARKLVADFPTDPGYQDDLAGALVSLAQQRSDQGDQNGALKLLNEALPYHETSLRANPNHITYLRAFAEYRATRAAVLLCQGEHAAASVLAEQLLKDAGEDKATDGYEATCLLARCAHWAEKDKKLPVAKRKELAAVYDDKAMAALRQAIQGGYDDLARLKQDTQLAALRGRADFKKLLAELEARTKHAGPG
jgi:hypothetical protein